MSGGTKSTGADSDKFATILFNDILLYAYKEKQSENCRFFMHLNIAVQHYGLPVLFIWLQSS